eukprot:6194499-Pleurochrysis_carterae.AAC.1
MESLIGRSYSPHMGHRTEIGTDAEAAPLKIGTSTSGVVIHLISHAQKFLSLTVSPVALRRSASGPDS